MAARIKQIALAALTAATMTFSHMPVQQTEANKETGLEELLTIPEETKEIQNPLLHKSNMNNIITDNYVWLEDALRTDKTRLAVMYLLIKQNLEELTEYVGLKHPLSDPIAETRKKLHASKNGQEISPEGLDLCVDLTEYINSKMAEDPESRNKIILCSYIKSLEGLELTASTKRMLQKKYETIKAQPKEKFRNDLLTVLTAKLALNELLDNEIKRASNKQKQEKISEYKEYMRNIHSKEMIRNMLWQSPIYAATPDVYR